MKICIGSVHLESLDTRHFREAQLEVIHSQLDQYKHSCLCGDFNFDSSRNFFSKDKRPLENLSLLRTYSEYIDVWSHLRPEEPGSRKIKKNKQHCKFKK